MHLFTPDNPVQHTIHWHTAFEIIYIAEGSAAFFVQDQHYEIGAGQALLISNEELHCGVNTKQSGCKYYAILFELDLPVGGLMDSVHSSFFDPLLKKKYKLPKVIKNEHPWEKDMIKQILEMIQMFEQKPLGFELAVKASLYRILFQIISNHQLVKNGDESRRANEHSAAIIKKALTFLHTHYSEKITLHDVASHVNMSESHFCKLFKTLTQKTFVEYINIYRINKACTLMKMKKCKALDASTEVGFNHYGYFVRLFKKYKKCTPTEYLETQ
ncbi:MAG: helix-turn-helix transcriptional regulator [Gorillibacterium sp.]|nr:helix-turn-helix transcriptional regulator [Gorillibacterium sp.]